MTPRRRAVPGAAASILKRGARCNVGVRLRTPRLRARDSSKCIGIMRLESATILGTGNKQEGEMNEQSKGVGWHTQGRVRSDSRRKAREMGGKRSALWRLGDISHEGVSCRSESPVRFPDKRLVWPD